MITHNVQYVLDHVLLYKKGYKGVFIAWTCLHCIIGWFVSGQNSRQIFWQRSSFEPSHETTNNLHMPKTKTQISFAVTAKLFSAFVFATWIVQFFFFLNPKFQASSCLLWLHSPVCVGTVKKPHCWFCHETAHLFIICHPCKCNRQIYF